MNTPKAVSVTKEGEPDGFVQQPGFIGQHEPGMPTRLLVSVPPAFLATVHRDLLNLVQGPFSLLYRQKVNRRNPAGEQAPPRDFLALGIEPEVLFAAFTECESLVYHDARAEFWVRGVRGEQVILDGDGLIYCYPDDLAFRDVCLANGLPEGELVTLLDRDYVKQWYHAENDAAEAGMIEALGLTEMPHRG